MSDNNATSIEDLQLRIAALEIDNKQLQKEVIALKRVINKSSQTGEDCSTTSRRIPLNKPENIRMATASSDFVDRHGKSIDLGDYVYIITNRAHTNRSRICTVSRFDEYRNRVYIEDEGGITQERAPKNLRKEANRRT